MSNDSFLHARPQAVTIPAVTGRQTLPVQAPRDSYLYVPPGYAPTHPAPLVLLLHGAGGHAHHGLDLLRHLADDAGVVLVAPASIDPTWDVIARQRYGGDVAVIDQCLKSVFERYAIDPARLAIGGFSDGASYAVSLGVDNGDLFTHVIAFSPGFMAPIAPRGKPRLFVSHGTRDHVLPIDPCSRRLVPRLRQAGYDVDYREFEGEHVIPAEIAQEAMQWFLGNAGAADRG
jgi:phospholipase/carboxylesterase